MSTLAPSRTTAPAVHTERAVLRLLGTSVTQLEAVRAVAEADLGIALEFITLDGAAAQRRGALQPQTFDVYDQWFHDLDLVWPTGSLQPLEIARLPNWDRINDLPKTGRLGPDARRAAGGDPSRSLFVQPDGRLSGVPTHLVSMIPTVHNADGFVVLGDDDASSWGDLLSPERAGRVILQSDPAIGAFDMLLALQATGEMWPRDPGDLTLDEIDALVAHLERYRAAGQFSAFWTDEIEAIDALREQRATIGSFWWSGLIRLKALGVSARMATPKEGYRGWFGGLALSAHLNHRRTDMAYEYLNWWLDGGPGAIVARNGAYLANLEAVQRQLSAAEWDFWYEGKPARAPIRDARGDEVYAIGETREGGSYHERMSKVVVWDTVMTEHNYLMRRWAQALAV